LAKNTGQALSVKSREIGLAKREQAELKYRNGDGYRVEHGMTKQANIFLAPKLQLGSV
jgi:hypothetical protein